jgi:hypothetical protein
MSITDTDNNNITTTVQEEIHAWGGNPLDTDTTVRDEPEIDLFEDSGRNRGNEEDNEEPNNNTALFDRLEIADESNNPVRIRGRSMRMIDEEEEAEKPKVTGRKISDALRKLSSSPDRSFSFNMTRYGQNSSTPAAPKVSPFQAVFPSIGSSSNNSKRAGKAKATFEDTNDVRQSSSYSSQRFSQPPAQTQASTSQSQSTPLPQSQTQSQGNNRRINQQQSGNWRRGLNEMEQYLCDIADGAHAFFTRGAETKEVRLVDFPEFKGGNQDPVEWLESFERACIANKVSEDRRVALVASYLKGTALTWYNRTHIQSWNDLLNPQYSFVNQFMNYFCNPFRISQWKHQLRNRKQKPGETVEEYIAAIEELWKRVDPQGNRTELDKIHEFIEGLRPEFIVPVQSAMPDTVEEAMDKTRALETAFSTEMDLSAYSLIPNYLMNMNGGMVPARTNLAMFQPAYTTNYQIGGIESVIEKKISEGILAALSQIRNETNPRINSNNNNNNMRNNNQNRGSNGCYVCGKMGHIARNCRQKNNQNNGNSRAVECYNCGRKGHIARDCRTTSTNRSSGTRNGSQNNQSLNY